MRAIITGASTGIGREMAKYAYSLGMEVWITGQNASALATLSEECGKAPQLAADLSTHAGQSALLSWIHEVKIDLSSTMPAMACGKMSFMLRTMSLRK